MTSNFSRRSIPINLDGVMDIRSVYEFAWKSNPANSDSDENTKYTVTKSWKIYVSMDYGDFGIKMMMDNNVSLRKKLKKKLRWSIVIHILWIMVIILFGVLIGLGIEPAFVDFLYQSKNCVYALLIYVIVVYALELIVYKVKPLENIDEKKLFWRETFAMTFGVLVVLIWWYSL